MEYGAWSASSRTRSEVSWRSESAESAAGLTRTRATLAVASLSALVLNAALGLVVMRQLSSTRRSQALLREQLERWQVTLASVGDAVIVADELGRVVFLNQVAESLCGRLRAEALQRPLNEVFRILPAGSPRADEHPIERVLRDGAVLTTASQTLEILPEGGERPVNLTAAPIRDSGGRICGAILAFRDDTDRREKERVLVEESRRKDEFLAMLAHELRNPLASILSAVQVLGLNVSPHDRELAREIIGRQTKQLANLLDVSRITHGLIQVRKEWIDGVAVLNRTIEATRPLFAQHGHHVDVTIAQPTLPLEADPVRFEQILVNLLANAARYTPRAGRIVVEAREDQGWVVIDIRDNGRGIEPAVLPTVFDLFAQGGRSLARSEGGLGIGLTIVKKLVELHGGSVSARSDGLGKGSTFTVRLPAAKENPVAASVSRGQSNQVDKGEKNRILIVDDNKDLATSLARLLGLLGHDVEVVFDGRMVVEAARSYRPRVVLLDIGLPNLDGYQVARRLRQEGFADAMIIAVSGYGQEEDRRRSREAGMDYHLTKPVDIKTITELIGQAG